MCDGLAVTGRKNKRHLKRLNYYYLVYNPHRWQYFPLAEHSLRPAERPNHSRRPSINIYLGRLLPRRRKTTLAPLVYHTTITIVGVSVLYHVSAVIAYPKDHRNRPSIKSILAFFTCRLAARFIFRLDMASSATCIPVFNCSLPQNHGSSLAWCCRPLNKLPNPCPRWILVVVDQIVHYVESLEVNCEWLPSRWHRLLSFSQNIVYVVFEVTSG